MQINKDLTSYLQFKAGNNKMAGSEIENMTKTAILRYYSIFNNYIKKEKVDI